MLSSRDGSEPDWGTGDATTSMDTGVERCVIKLTENSRDVIRTACYNNSGENFGLHLEGDGCWKVERYGLEVNSVEFIEECLQ
jgi:hypothetical protein